MKSFRILTACMLLVLGACSAAGTDDAPYEAEATATGDAELRSAVDCRARIEIGYPNRDGVGKPIRVVTIGGKAITRPTAHAFLKMQAAAQSAGVALSLTSGFRTNAEQTRLYNCYVNGEPGCNPADPPGTSAHQKGTASDVSTSAWLSNNAERFGFQRPYAAREPWHIEFNGTDPGGPCGTADGETATVSPHLPWVSPHEGGDYTNGIWMKVRPDENIAKVVYTAGNYKLGESDDTASDYALRYVFNTLGPRSITATAYASDGKPMFSSTVNIHISP